jgi:hypothetical protein
MLAPGWLEQATRRSVLSPKLPSTVWSNPAVLVQQAGPQEGNWIGRHAVLFGALVGFGGGYLLGYLPGDDAVFYDFTAEFNGLVLGGVGAGVGALVGAVATN